MRHDKVTPQDRGKILTLFAAGNSVSHIVYLLDYEYDSDHVNQVLRERIAELEEVIRGWQQQGA